MPLFQQNIRYAQKQKKYDQYTEGEKAVNRNYLQVSPHFGFNKDFKVVIINMFKELRETMLKKLKEVRQQ